MKRSNEHSLCVPKVPKNVLFIIVLYDTTVQKLRRKRTNGIKNDSAFFILQEEINEKSHSGSK